MQQTTLGAWGWLNIPSGFKGWVYVQMTGPNSFATCSKTSGVNFDWTNVTAIGLKNDSKDKGTFTFYVDCFYIAKEEQ